MNYLVFAKSSGPMRPVYHSTEWKDAARVQGQIHQTQRSNPAWLGEFEPEDLEYFEIHPKQVGWLPGKHSEQIRQLFTKETSNV